jgi:hypothetical protein
MEEGKDVGVSSVFMGTIAMVDESIRNAECRIL